MSKISKAPCHTKTAHAAGISSVAASTAVVVAISIALLLAAASAQSADAGPGLTGQAGQTVLAAPDAAIATQRADILVPRTLRLPPFDVPRSLQIPKGFAIDVVARVPDARFMVVLPNRDLLVSNPENGSITLVRPAEQSGASPTYQGVFASGLRRPHDLVLHRVRHRLPLHCRVEPNCPHALSNRCDQDRRDRNSCR